MMESKGNNQRFGHDVHLTRQVLYVPHFNYFSAVHFFRPYFGAKHSDTRQPFHFDIFPNTQTDFFLGYTGGLHLRHSLEVIPHLVQQIP